MIEGTGNALERRIGTIMPAAGRESFWQSVRPHDLCQSSGHLMKSMGWSREAQILHEASALASPAGRLEQADWAMAKHLLYWL